ncbi:unnamed protein product [Ectocarpus fasciculatus]
MAKPGKRRRGGPGNVRVPAAKHRASNMTAAAATAATAESRPSSPPTPAATTPIQHSNNGKEETSAEKTSKKKKRKNKRQRQQEGETSSSTQQSRGSTSSSTRRPPPPPPTSKKPSRVKEKPARFVHPHLDAELRRLRRSWLSPGDPLFKPALDRSYRGVRHEPAGSLPQVVHKGFRQSFDSLHEAGLFLYDTVQAGGKRLSRTFVTRTLVGDPGITYKYLGLRLFAHPWGLGESESESDFRKGPGDGLADALNDPCLADLFSKDGASDGEGSVGRSEDNLRGSSFNDNDRVADTLRKVGDLSEWMRLRAGAMLKEEVGEAGGERGSCAFNLTLINRMECSGAKRDLKPDPLFSMGKCSVSWHADSCLQDFSTIGVYHCTDPVPAEPDWGIALRVSTEASGGGDGDAVSNDEKTRKKVAERGLKPGAKAVAPIAASAAEAVPEKQRDQVLTPPLLIPLQSGDAYFLLDDFNHFHEHAVVSGSSTLRYSSTHRVADTDGNTFSHVQQRCEQALAGGGATAAAGGDDQILNLAQVRAEQALLTELESEWLNQFWVQGRRHASLHPWWRGPMALVLATWRELERRTALTVQRLMSLRGGGGGEGVGPGAGGRAAAAAAAAVAEPAAIAKAFETVLRALEERRESRSRWEARFADPAYRSLASDLAPVVPALWPAEGRNGGSDGGDEGSPLLLPQSLGGVVSRLRECYTVVYRAASGGKKAGSAKAIAAGAASNWELFRAASSPSSGGRGAGKKHSSALGKHQHQHQHQRKKRGVAGQERLEKKKRRADSVVKGGDDGGRGRTSQGQGSRRKSRVRDEENVSVSQLLPRRSANIENEERLR